MRCTAPAILLALCAACAWIPTATAAEAPDLPEPRWRAFQTGAVRADRLQHVSLAFTGGLGAGLVTRRAGAAALSGVTFGVAKELLDARTSGFDWADLAADLAGAGLATLAVAALER